MEGRNGGPLEVRARSGRHAVKATSRLALQPASGKGLDAALVAEKLGRLGGTPFRAGSCEAAELEPGLHLPVSELNELRRLVVKELLPLIERGPTRTEDPRPAVERARAAAAEVFASLPPSGAPGHPPRIVPLCRNDAQLEAVIAAGLPEVELDWMELVGLAKAVLRARAAGLKTTIATVRVQKPGEEAYDARIAALSPDAVLVRHFGGLVHFASLPPAGRPELHGDFSLNVTNGLTAAEVLRAGLATFTLSHDLDEAQMSALLEHVPPERATVVLHHRIATFHTEHCVYAHLLSEGRDFRTCGRPCETSGIALRDHQGRDHPVVVDVACRNTVFNSELQSAAAFAPTLIARGVKRFRVEFVRETADEAARALAAYSGLLRGELSPSAAARAAGATQKTGVAVGPMAVLV